MLEINVYGDFIFLSYGQKFIETIACQKIKNFLYFIFLKYNDFDTNFFRKKMQNIENSKNMRG